MTLESTIEIRSGSSGSDYLQRARDVAPLIEAEADAAERETDVTAAVAQALKDAGLFWMFSPRKFGGGEVDITTALQVMEEIARADGSTGWMFMATSIGTRNASLYLADDARQELFGGEEKAICGGFGGAIGKAVRVEGGYRGSSERVPFGSGSTYITHIAAGMRLFDENGNPVLADNGQQEMRMTYIPRERFSILGNWDVMGLVASGSYDYQVPEQFVPERFTLPLVHYLDPFRPVQENRIDRASLGAAGHAGVALGIMKRALQEVARITDGKSRQGYPEAVGDYPVFLHGFSEKEATYQAARRYVLDAFGEAEATAAATGEVPAVLIARMRQATTWAHKVADEVVSFCHLWGGTQAVRNPSALGRCTRDMAVAKNHLFVDPITYVTTAGPILDTWR